MNQATEKDLKIILGIESFNSEGKQNKIPAKYKAVIDRAEQLIAKRSRQSGLSIETLVLCCLLAEIKDEDAKAEPVQDSAKEVEQQPQGKMTADDLKEALLAKADADADFPHSKTEIHTANKSTLEKWLKEAENG